MLDVDCEGVELDVLRGIEFRPRLLTVEAHPHLGCSREAVETALTGLGYDIVDEEPITPESESTNYVAVRDV